MRWIPSVDKPVSRLVCGVLVSGVLIGTIFAVNPKWDLWIAALFFDQEAEKFPLATDYTWNIVRQIANCLSFLLLSPAAFVLLRKLVFPRSKMLIAPSVVLFLVGSFALGPGVTTNLLLKENWGRPRPNHVHQFAGAADFEPWWRPGGACEKNCSFVSGEASQAFWAVAPASLAPPQVRPVALSAAVVFGASVGGLRIAFGRHFFTDVAFAAVVTILIIVMLYRLLIDPVRRNDGRLEKAIERTFIAVHRSVGAVFAGLSGAIARASCTLRHTGRHLRKRIACL